MLKISLVKKPYEGFFCMNEKIIYNSVILKVNIPIVKESKYKKRKNTYRDKKCNRIYEMKVL
jgi:hypothetical protein